MCSLDDDLIGSGAEAGKPNLDHYSTQSGVYNLRDMPWIPASETFITNDVITCRLSRLQDCGLLTVAVLVPVATLEY